MDLRSPRVWRPKHAAMFAFAERHTFTVEQLARGFFPGGSLAARKKKANRWLVKQRRRLRIDVVGIVQRRDTGRPELCYGRRCKQDMIEHEVRVADLALRFIDCPFVRGARVGKTEADAMMIRRGRRCYIEIDNSGKMTAKQMEAKWKRYVGGTDGDILVVALTEGRMHRLRRAAELVKNIALFTTFERLNSGMATPWIDWFGEATDI